MPLTFRLMAALVAASVFVSLVVAFMGAEHAYQKRAAAEREQARVFADGLAARTGLLLQQQDDMRLAILAATVSEVGYTRVLFLDERGNVRLDTGLAMGGQRLGLVAYQGTFQRIKDNELETLAPVVQAGKVIGEVRLRKPRELHGAAELSWSLFGLVFLGSLSIVAVACLMCHHWLARVRELARNTRSLAAGDVDVMRRRPAAGELRELQEALGELGITLSQGLHKVQDGFIDMAVQIVDALERRGITPPGHGERTSRYASLLAERLGLLPEDVRELELAARLHDMGKMWIRASVLGKSEPLDNVERESLRNHPDRAARLLECLPSLSRVAVAIRHHHEKYDGNGFPHGLRGERIPLGSRILAIGDAYDQLTSCNIYGEPLAWPDALDKLREDRGVHFDPWLLDLFEEEIRKDPLPRGVDRPVMISTEGVVPYKMAEESRREQDEDAGSWDAEGEVELMVDEASVEEEL